MEYQEMREMEKTHCCAMCLAPLVTIWDGELARHRLVCGQDRSHQGYQMVLSPSQALARGELGNKLGDKSQEELEKMAAAGAPALSRLPQKDLATNELLTKEVLSRLISWGEGLGLKPYLGHVCLYFGNPYVTIDGYYYLMNQEPTQLNIGTRPLNVGERQLYQIADGDHAWIAEAYLGSEKLATTGIGIVTKEEIEGKSTKKPEQFRAPVVHDHPQRMAEKRAEWQLLRKLISLEEVD